MAIIRASIMRSTRAAISRPLRPATSKIQECVPYLRAQLIDSALRTYASKDQATQGQASPGTASNVGNPGSVSAEQQQIKQSRATDSTSSPDNASLQTPVSNPSGASVGQQTENTSTQDTFKQDPDAPASEKRKNVEDKGNRPLDPADK